MPEKKITPTNPVGQQPETAQHDTNVIAGRKTALGSHKFRRAARMVARKTGLTRVWSDRGLKGNVVAVTW